MKKPGPILAFDRQSVRSYDADGRLHVAQTNISKANVNPYYGEEIPNYAELGLDPAKIYNLWRDPVELEKAAASFANMPLQLKHVHQKASDPQQDLIVGSVGSPVFEFPYLKASLCVWNEEGIAAVETETMVELSSSYHYAADMTPGTTPDGEPFDGRMTNIAGNHVALVESGRAGRDVVVADSALASPNPLPPKQELPAMKPTKLGLALKLALSAASPKIAQDSSLGALVGQAKKKAFDKKAVLVKLLAMDSEIDTGQLDAIIDAIIGVEEDPEPQTPITAMAGDEGDPKHAEVMDFLKGKGMADDDLENVKGMLGKISAPDAAKDEDPDDSMSKEDVSTAMDSMRKDLTKQFRDLETAKAAVRGTVGDVIGMDSAAGVYRFALDHLKIDHKDMPDAGLGSLYKVASDRPSAPVAVNHLAHDSAIAKAIPGLDRFS